MQQTLKNALTDWNSATKERVQLQQIYLGLFVVVILLAGLIGLIDQEISGLLVTFALLCLAAFVVNMLTWALASGLVLQRLQSRSTVRPASSRSKKATKNSTDA